MNFIVSQHREWLIKCVIVKRQTKAQKKKKWRVLRQVMSDFM